MNSHVDKTVLDIKNLKIQGATKIALSSINALGFWSKKKTKWSYQQLIKQAEKLYLARPTEPLTQNCISWLLEKAKNKEGEPLNIEVDNINKVLQKAKIRSVEAGSSLVKDGMKILTHCHSSSVVDILLIAKKSGKRFKVYLTETRPRFQGRITARELVSHDIDVVMIPDSQAAYIISNEDEINLNLILLGADAINADGSAINKVGSYGISLSAKNAGIPLFVAAVLLKYSPFPLIIEERDPKEVWDDPPKELKIKNMAFDKIPASYISGFITEAGIIKTKEVTQMVKQIYPWIFSKDQSKRIKTWVNKVI